MKIKLSQKIILFLALVVVFCVVPNFLPIFAATLTISDAGGNWDSVDTWVEGAIPTSADDVVAQADGTSGNLTINAVGAECNSFDMTNYTGTVTHDANITLTIYGDLFKFVPGMTYTVLDPGTSSLYFLSSTGTAESPTQITTAGKTSGYVIFDNVNNYFQLNDDITAYSIWLVGGYILANVNLTISVDEGSIAIEGSGILKNSGTDSTLTIKSVVDIIIQGNITSTSNKLNLILNSDSTGAGSGSISILTGSNIDTNGGDITIGGGSGTISAGSGFAIGSSGYGVYITNSTINANGGNIIINGQGYAISTLKYGVYILNTTTTSIATNGSGTINITANGRGTGGSNYGLYVKDGGVISTENGNLTVTATGGGATTGTSNHGVYITGTGSTIKTTGSGNLLVTGTGGNASGTGGSNYGVYVSNANGLQTTGTGNITVIGTGGHTSGSGTNNYGVYTYSVGASITACSDCNINITGTGGNSSSSGNHGVYVNMGSQISTTGTGAINIIATGGGITNSGSNYGLYVVSSSSTISAQDGDITITATGGGAGSGTNRYGVYVSTNSTIKTTGSGDLIVTGIGGGSYAGVIISVANGFQTTSTGNITINTDFLSLNQTSNINCAGLLTIALHTPSLTINVSNGFIFLYGAANISYLTYASLQIGNSSQTGTTTVDARSTWTKPITFAHSASSGSISIAGAQTNTSSFTFAGPTTLSADITASALTISSGTFDAGAGTTIQLTGDFSNSGTFTPNQSTVTLASGTHIITGATEFYNLTLNPSNTITFPASATQTITNTFSCTGTAGNTITINSSSAGTKANLSKASGSISCDYLALTDSNATGGATWNAGSHSTNVSNNSGWVFDITAPTTTATATSGGSSYTFGNWAVANVIITLSCSDGAGVGCDSSYPKYCTDTTNTCNPATAGTIYTTSITISDEGTTYIRYYSQDTIPNTESVSSQIIKIDKITPIISNTSNSLGYLTNTQTATITWTTNEASSTQVEYGFTNSYGSTTTETDTTTRVTSHTVEIPLAPCQLYHLRVISKDQATNQATGDNFTIQTQCASGGNASQVFSIQPITPSQTNQNSNNNQEISQQDPRITLMQKIIELLKEMIRILMQKKGLV
ncbi:MAG: hypothetical protein A2256_03095 [Candidatus Staskawiczbacteria bacterium RIFOXYA2_FULL_32_7]|nr:MAG: hypothetical protein A2256_03095 [Candidatus Staskawiczbacteria bacterium RIFOXYA2_FULL_32_7]OGZ85040.1 MAG: hypothetical protein A2463_04655 [Candidatus Staskawiczbacteria bacterium RIFOXYC2_FULL_32_10]